jgi:HAUS augmin-like complex subunit 4
LAAAATGGSELVEPGAGGVPDRFLGITSDYLYQVQQQQPAMTVVCKMLAAFAVKVIV